MMANPAVREPRDRSRTPLKLLAQPHAGAQRRDHFKENGQNRWLHLKAMVALAFWAVHRADE